MPIFGQHTYPYAGKPGVESRLADLLAAEADDVVHQEPGVVLPVQPVYHHFLAEGGGVRVTDRAANKHRPEMSEVVHETSEALEE